MSNAASTVSKANVSHYPMSTVKNFNRRPGHHLSPLSNREGNFKQMNNTTTANLLATPIPPPFSPSEWE